jgi:flagellar biogenesis protein FliO
VKPSCEEKSTPNDLVKKIMREEEHAAEEFSRADERRWFRIYAAVLIYTALLICALWLFSRLFA